MKNLFFLILSLMLINQAYSIDTEVHEVIDGGESIELGIVVTAECLGRNGHTISRTWEIDKERELAYTRSIAKWISSNCAGNATLKTN